MSRTALYNKWTSHSVAMRATLRVTPSFKPWTSRTSTRLHGVPPTCSRVMEMIDICYIDIMKQNQARPAAEQLTDDELVLGLFVDLSQAVQRRPWSYGVRTLHKRALIYSYQIDCVLPVWALFRLHGFPKNIVLEQSASSLQGLVGESWSLPCAATAFYPMYLTPSAPWWKR